MPSQNLRIGQVQGRIGGKAAFNVVTYFQEPRGLLVIEARHEGIDLINKTGINASQQISTFFGQVELVTAPVVYIIVSGDQPVPYHTLNNTGGIALCAEQAIAQIDVINAGIVRDVQKDIKTRDVEAVIRKIGLLVVINVKEYRLQRFVQMHFHLRHFAPAING